MGQRFSIGAKRPREEEQEEPHAVVKRARQEEECYHDVATSSVPIVAPASPEARDGLAREIHKLLSPTGAQFKVEPVPRAIHAFQEMPGQLDHMITLWGRADRVEHALRLVIPFVRYSNELAVAQGQGDEWLRANPQVFWLLDRGVDRLLIALASSPIVDLCRQELNAFETIDLPPNCTLRNGTINLHGSSTVLVAAEGVHFEDLTLNGVGQQKRVVEIDGGLSMECCCVDGGSVAAVGVYGVEEDSTGSSSSNGGNDSSSSDSGSGNGSGTGSGTVSLTAKMSSIHSSTGTGLAVHYGGRAVLEGGCSVSDNGAFGAVAQGKGSMLTATHSSIDRNVQGNIVASDGAQVTLHEISSDGSKDMHGWYVDGEGSHLTAHHSHASSNKGDGAFVVEGGSATLHSCKCNENGVDGLSVQGGSLAAHSCHSSSNGECGAFVLEDGSAMLSSCKCCNNGESGFYVQDISSVLVVKGESRATGNADGNAIKWDDSHLLCLDNCDLEGQEVQSCTEGQR